jgi:hypothetical protein
VLQPVALTGSTVSILPFERDFRRQLVHGLSLVYASSGTMVILFDTTILGLGLLKLGLLWKANGYMSSTVRVLFRMFRAYLCALTRSQLRRHYCRRSNRVLRPLLYSKCDQYNCVLHGPV